HSVLSSARSRLRELLAVPGLYCARRSRAGGAGNQATFMTSTESNPRRNMTRSISICALTLVLASCNINDQGQPPPPDQFFFPTGVAAHPFGRWLYVTNANTDLRFSGGSVMAVDFDAAVSAFSRGACSLRDPIDTRIPVCDTGDTDPADPSRHVVHPTKTVRVGSFAGLAAVQRFLKPQSQGLTLGTKMLCTLSPNDPTCIPQFDPDPGQGIRLLMPVRGDPSMTWINVAADGQLDCGQNSGLAQGCNAVHRLT